jgi:protein gp37
VADQREGGIAWTEQTWNPIRGCTRISKGCTRCYAEVVAARFSDEGLAYEGLARRTSAGPRWTGKLVVVDEHMADPIRWQRPRMIFVNSMSDLFHESLPIEAIARVYAVMLLAPHHTFQVLTKRARRMREVLSDSSFYGRVLEAANEFRDRWPKLTGIGISDPTLFPPKHVWNGVSVEDQDAADERLPELVRVPSAVRWISVEPQLGAVRLSPAMLPALQWVVIGGESGHDAREFKVEWARSLMAQCRDAGVRVFMKQTGSNPTATYYDEGYRELHEAGGIERPDPIGWDYRDGQPPPDTRMSVRGVARAGGEPAEWPEDLRVREFPR